MGLLDFDDKYKPPFRPPTRWEKREEKNFEKLQNLGRKEVTEDFGDSPFADREPEVESE